MFSILIGPMNLSPVEQAEIEPNGLLAVGGDLSSVRLLNALSFRNFPGTPMISRYSGGVPTPYGTLPG